VSKVIRRTAKDLPPVADTYTQKEPDVMASYRAGKALYIRTFSGVELMVEIIKVRQTSTGPVYDVKPVGDPKIKEFQKAGVPVNESNAREQFVAFDWQVIR